MPSGNVQKARPIAGDPWIVQTVDPSLNAFLSGLPAPDFETVADTKALWATAADFADEGSILVGGGGGTLSSYVVSAETYKRVKAYRY